ncbi:Psmd12 [Symbiodinium microadriaticum]|nr:Psmd12 [Symbiodinium microadriaticum]
MMHRLRLLKDVQLIPSFARLLTLFTTNEVIPFPFEHQDEVQEAIASTQSEENVAITQHFVALLATRVTEHNIRVMKGYYSRIHGDRMCQMLGLTADQLEEHLSEMSARGDVYVKIDRPRGIISFVEPTSAEEVLSDWAGSVSSMLSLMESTCHLINRENMVHKL